MAAVPLTFGTALVLGAIVAPPDAVTAVAVGRKLGLPKRVMAILTGESLINDAAALALFSVAVAQVAGSHTFIENPFLLFGYSAVVGPLVGAALGYVTLWIRRRLANPGLETVQGLVVPFAAFIAAENLHASGVLAVVVAGFVVGQRDARRRLSDPAAGALRVELGRRAAGGVRVRLHRSAPAVRAGGSAGGARIAGRAVAVASAIVLVIVLVIRPLSVFLMFGSRVLSRHVESRLSVPGSRPGGGRGALGTRRQARRAGTVAHHRSTHRSLTWQENVVVSWTGHARCGDPGRRRRIPVTTVAGEPFPERATIQAIAFVVSVGTLLLQGWTLPLLIRRLGLLLGRRPRLRPRGNRARPSGGARRRRRACSRGSAADPPPGLTRAHSPRSRSTIARHSQDADEMPDPEAHTLRAEVFASALPRCAAQRNGRP